MYKFLKPNKIIDYVKRHLEKRIVGKYDYYHLVYKAKGLLLNNIILFKNHVEMVYKIRLREEKGIS
jgi:hypothetical protein